MKFPVRTTTPDCHLFPGFYDLEAGLLESFIDAYRRYYPDNLAQPSFFVCHNNLVTRRLRSDWGDSMELEVVNGDMAPETLIVRFLVCTATELEYCFEAFMFDLKNEAGCRFGVILLGGSTYHARFRKTDG